MADFTIPSPAGGSFTVTIKDSTGSIVYGPSAETNAAFDPGLGAPGDYIMYVTNDGNTNGWCFTIPDCDCPTFTVAGIRVESGMYFADLTFDMSAGFPCQFVLDVATAYTTALIEINNLADFTSHVGSFYTKTIYIGGPSYLTFTIRKKSDMSICTPAQTITYTPACDGPVMNYVSPGRHFIIALYGGTVLSIYGTWSDDGTTCGTYNVNWIQTNAGYTSGVADSGSASGTADLIGGFHVPITPNTSFPGYVNNSSLRYHVVLTTCCEVAYDETNVRA